MARTGEQAQARLSFCKLIKIDVGGDGSLAGGAVAFLIATCSAMIPPALCAAICVATDVPAALTLLAFLVVAIVSVACAVLWFRWHVHLPATKAGSKRPAQGRKRR
jgi:membrane protein implicated in regulation of membrane protease activity